MWLLGVGAFLLSVGLGGLVTRIVHVEKQRLAVRMGNLQAAADRLGGRVIPARPFHHESLQFTIDGVPGELTLFLGAKTPPFTRIRFSWTPPGRMRIVPEDFTTSVRKFFGAVEIQIGDAEFDAAFLIQGAPESWVREALGPEVRRHLFALRDLGVTRAHGKGIRLDLGPTGLLLEVRRRLTQERAWLDSFLEHTIGLLSVLRGWKGAAPQVLSVAEAIAAGHCVVCGNPLAEPIRRCPTCRTPHHAECWDYFGGCAIFGCAPGPAADLKGGKSDGKPGLPHGQEAEC